MLTKYSLSLDEARAVVSAGCVAAAALRPLSIAVVDDAGILLAFQRMDGARGYTVELAIQKARSSALVGVDSATLAKAGAAGGGAGGLPVFREGQCIGAIGVSGSSESDDVSVAREAIAAL